MQRTFLIALAVAALTLCQGASAKGGGGHSHSSGSHSSGSHASSSHAGGSHYVSGYTKKNGTYVAPHHATNPDHSTANNWSHKGNVNPYTGKPGTKNN